jgi:hypothetical protein
LERRRNTASSQTLSVTIVPIVKLLVAKESGQPEDSERKHWAFDGLQATQNSGKTEPRAEGMRSVDQKRELPQLALRASKHGLSLLVRAKRHQQKQR